MSRKIPTNLRQTSIKTAPKNWVPHKSLKIEQSLGAEILQVSNGKEQSETCKKLAGNLHENDTQKLPSS